MEGGDFPELQAAVEVEDENLPMGVRQPEYRLAEPVGLLTAEHGGLRGGGGVLQIQFLVGDVGVAALAAAFLQPGVFADAA